MPLTSATCANRARRQLPRVSSATAWAPRNSVAASAGSAARSARRTTLGSRLLVAIGLTIKDEQISEIHVIADPPRLRQFDLAVLSD